MNYNLKDIEWTQCALNYDQVVDDEARPVFEFGGDVYGLDEFTPTWESPWFAHWKALNDAGINGILATSLGTATVVDLGYIYDDAVMVANITT